MRGRPPRLNSGTKFSLWVEAGVKEEFIKVCDRRGISASQFFTEFMLKEIKRYQGEVQLSMQDFADPVNEPKFENKAGAVLSVDLGNMIDLMKIDRFVDSLDEQQALRAQGLGTRLWRRGKLVTSKRRMGLAPVPVE